MRKISLLAMLLVVALILNACGGGSVSEGTEVNPDNSSGQTLETPEPEESPAASVDLAEQVLYDENGILISVRGLDLDSWFGPEIKLAIENNSDIPIMIQTRNTSINGAMMDFMFSSEIDVGKKANDAITLMSSQLEAAGIETIKDIEFNFVISDKNTWDTLFTSDMISLTTSGSEGYVQEFDTSGFLAFDQNDIRIRVKKLDSTDSFWGADVYLMIENDSDQNIIVQLRDTSINGYMIDPAFSPEINSGKVSFDEITFFESDLEDNGIEEIEEMEFKFHIFNSETWNDILTSDSIIISFSN